MFFYNLHYHVVDVDFRARPYLIGEYGVHGPLVRGVNVFEAEGNEIMIVVSTV